nr:SDR family oxidoreductase [Ignatzschineria rhizosphaerae]
MKERVLVTGGMSGIGKSIVEACEKKGYETVVIDRLEGGIVADLSNEIETASALEEALKGGPITRLVNNVGVVMPASIENQTYDEIKLAWELNVRVAIQCVQALLPSMKEAKFGRIVNMSSRAALGKELRTAYASTKAGLIGVAKVWALELGEYGITANAIGPGPIETELFIKANPLESELTQNIIRSVPVKRLGKPEDIANAALFFLDDASGFITGQTLYVCGGLTVGKANI